MYQHGYVFIVLVCIVCCEISTFSFARKVRSKWKNDKNCEYSWWFLSFIAIETKNLFQKREIRCNTNIHACVSVYNVMVVYLRLAQLLGSGRANRLCANAIVAPIVSSVNVRSTDILQRKELWRGKKEKIKTKIDLVCEEKQKLRQFYVRLSFHLIVSLCFI